MIGVYDYTVILTYLSLLSASSGIVVSLWGKGHPFIGIFFLLLCGLLDAFDGKVARTKADRTELEKKFGVQIDSLSDLVAFGVLPACIGASLIKNELFLKRVFPGSAPKWALRQESALYGRARCVPPPAAFASSGFTERFVWARTMRRLRLTDTLRGISPGSALKKRAFGPAGGRKSPFPPESGVRRGFAAFCTCGSLCSFPRIVPPAPRRKPHPSCGLREQRPHPRSAAARRTGVGALPQRREPAARTQRRARVRQAEAVRSLWQRTPMSYGAGTRALTSCRAPPASA